MAGDDVSYLAERIEDIIARLSRRNRCHALHLGDSSSGRGHNVGEASDDLGEWSLSYDDQRSVDDGDALSWGLERLGLLGDHVDVADHLSWCELSDDWDSHSHGRGEDLSEGDHCVGGKIRRLEEMVVLTKWIAEDVG